jgi:uncharacterized cupin superfamily protein
MSRGSKVFRTTDLPESNSSGYPAPFRDGQRKRWNRRLGDHGGLKNYGVNFVRVEPGGQSSARHSHTKQDEFVYIIEGEFVLVTDAGRETVGPGTCIAFPAGTGDGHHFLNASGRGRPHSRRRSHLSGHRLGVEGRPRWSKDVSS